MCFCVNAEEKTSSQVSMHESIIFPKHKRDDFLKTLSILVAVNCERRPCCALAVFPATSFTVAWAFFWQENQKRHICTEGRRTRVFWDLWDRDKVKRLWKKQYGWKSLSKSIFRHRWDFFLASEFHGSWIFYNLMNGWPSEIYGQGLKASVAPWLIDPHHFVCLWISKAHSHSF